MEISSSQLKMYLLGMNLATEEEFEQVEKQADEKGLPILEYLPQSGLITDSHLGQLLASVFHVKFIELAQERIQKNILELLPEAVARAQEAIIFREEEHDVHLATANPNNYVFI